MKIFRIVLCISFSSHFNDQSETLTLVKNTITVLPENQHYFRQINVLTNEFTRELISQSERDRVS